jgi:tetratricopeptide (TPR) repeat protein/SAM-dependent methyltransferase
MNRHERRAQGKAEPARPGAGPRPKIREILDAAFAAHRAGQPGEAERLCREVLASDPRNADALHLLGVLARQFARPDIAADLIGQAIAIDRKAAPYHASLGNALSDMRRPGDALASFKAALRLKPDLVEAHVGLGNTLKDLGRLDDALGAYSAALRLRPNHVEALNALGNTYKDMGRLDEAVAAYGAAIAAKPALAALHYNLGNTLRDMGRLEEAVAAQREAIRLKPDFAEAHSNLGNVLRDMGRGDEALAAFAAALGFRPDAAEIHNNLGGTLKDLGRFDDAVASYKEAIRLRPDYAEAYSNLGTALYESGNPQDGLSCCAQSLKLKETPQAKSSFVECLMALQPPAVPDAHVETALRALTENWSRPGKLAPVILGTVRKNLESSGVLENAAPDDGALARLGDEKLLTCLMRMVPINDAALERLLTACRAALVRRAAAEIAPPVLDFLCALADQCFLNQYVFADTDDERAQVVPLRASVETALAEGRLVDATSLMALACHVPLHALAGAEKLPSLQWPGCVQATLAAQVSEPLLERQLQAGIARLTPIGDGVSALVRQQYEENPYPRWLKTEPVVACASAVLQVRRQIPRAPVAPLDRPTADILVAGCGTGLHPIETALTFPASRVLAIDLSLASLGYAARKAKEIGVGNLEFAQADILKLGAIERRFDVIESVGVLHHLADPEAGLGVLVSRLRPRGLLKLGLYSEHARRNVVAVRDFIAERGFASDAAGIRRCRQELLALEAGDIRRSVTHWPDFASASECRDLLFHVQEHRHTLPEIARWLERHGLAFLGFEISPELGNGFRSLHPDAGAETDLGLWDAFERRNPDIFTGMYQFWVQLGL